MGYFHDSIYSLVYKRIKGLKLQGLSKSFLKHHSKRIEKVITYGKKMILKLYQAEVTMKY